MMQHFEELEGPGQGCKDLEASGRCIDIPENMEHT